MRIIISSKISRILLWIFFFQVGINFPVLGQVEDGMLIFQVDGNRYTRKNFNENGELNNYQTIEVGEIINSDKNIESKMTVITYDADGALKDASQTTLVCSPESKQVLMGIFPFAGGKSNKSLVVEMNEGAIMYPSDWRQLTELKDFNFSLNFKGGAAGFFGTKSDVSITDRKVMALENTFGVSGKLTMNAFIIGLKVSTVKYDYFEKIDEQKGIVSQKFTEDNRSYFTIEIIE